MQRFALLLSAGLGAGCLQPSCNAQNLLLDQSAFTLAHAPYHLFSPAPPPGWVAQVEHLQPWLLPEFQGNNLFLCRTDPSQRIALNLAQSGTNFWNRLSAELGYARSIKGLLVGTSLKIERQFAEGTANRYQQQLTLGLVYPVARHWRIGLLITDLEFGSQTSDYATRGIPATLALAFTPSNTWSFELIKTFGTTGPQAWSIAGSWRYKKLGVLSTLQFPIPQWRALFTYDLAKTTLGIGQEKTRFTGYSGTLFFCYAF